MRRHLKLHHKTALAFFAFALVASSITAGVMYRQAQLQVMRDIRQRLHDMVAVAALSLDGRTHMTLTRPEQENSPAFLDFKARLQALRDASRDVRYVYTLRIDHKDRIVFVVDAEENPANQVHLGHVYDDASPFLQKEFATLTGPLVETSFYTDQWGTWLSGYAPFFTPEGVKAGVLGMDISAATVATYEHRLLWHALGIFGLTLPLMLALGYLVGRALSRPIMAMQAGARRIGDGDLSVRLDVDRADEIGVLAQTLNEMTEGLQKSRLEMAELANKYQGIFDSAVEGIFQSTPDGRLLTANPALAHMLGYQDPEDLLASVRDLGERLYRRAEDRLELVAQLETRGRVDHLELPFKRLDGGELWVELSAHMTHDRQGRALLEGMLQDVTERRARHKAEQARRQAEAASRAKSDFLANMSHEIRTPLNAVLGLSDLLLRTGLSDKQRQYLGKIKTSGQALLAVINDILDFSKIEAGRLELERAPFDLFEVLANLTEMFAHQAHEKDLELVVNIDPGLPVRLVGDPVRLGQVLINLTSNALKFTRKGEVVISAGPSPETAPPGRVALWFSVKDTGAGIPPDRLEEIFESFTQADNSTTRKYGGTGLGLAICKKLVFLMGGAISAQSTPGQGSEFSFTAMFELAEQSQSQFPCLPPDLRGLRVLVVDDNSTARQILCGIIDSFQMEAVEASGGLEALEILEHAHPPFDLILLDWKMPEMGGVETARRIKRLSSRGKAPIICMVSAYGREDLLQQGEKSLLDAFLHKPVNQSLLFDTIMGLFGRQSCLTDQRGATLAPADFTDLRLAGRRVLLAEDNQINQEVAREWLESAGLVVEVAADGAQAVRMVAAGQYDAVLMDIQMPELDGYQATVRIREMGPHGRLPIIAMTAHALKGDREKCLAAGMDDYITKPIDPDRMMAVLGQWLGGPAQPAAPPRPLADPARADAPPDWDLPGVDLAAGFQRANRKRELYLKLLRSFRADFGRADREMAQAVQAGDWEGARRLAHSLKGVGANLGADGLSQAAAQLEQAAQQQSLDRNGSVWNHFQERLTEVMAGLDRGLPAPESSPPGDPSVPASDPAQASQDLARLAELLDEDLERARELTASLRPTLEPLGPAWGQLSQALDDFDLDAAAEAIDRLRALCQGNQA